VALLGEVVQADPHLTHVTARVTVQEARDERLLVRVVDMNKMAARSSAHLLRIVVANLAVEKLVAAVAVLTNGQIVGCSEPLQSFWT